MNRKKRKKRIIILIIIGVIAALIVFAVLRIQKAKEELAIATANQSINTVAVTQRNIRTKVIGNGALAEGDLEDLKMPKGLKIKEVYVETGDPVTEGQVLAKVDHNSVRDAIADVQSQINKIDEELLEVEDKTQDEDLLSPVSGTVEAVYAENGSDASSLMEQYGSILTLISDGDQREVRITALSGQIRDIRVEEGSHVSQGDTLFTLRAVQDEITRGKLLTQRQDLSDIMDALYDLAKTDAIISDRTGIVRAVNVKEGETFTGAAASSSTDVSAAGIAEDTAALYSSLLGGSRTMSTKRAKSALVSQFLFVDPGLDAVEDGEGQDAAAIEEETDRSGEASPSEGTGGYDSEAASDGEDGYASFDSSGDLTDDTSEYDNPNAQAGDDPVNDNDSSNGSNAVEEGIEIGEADDGSTVPVTVPINGSDGTLDLSSFLSEALKDVDLNQLLGERLKNMDLNQIILDRVSNLDLNQIIIEGLKSLDLTEILTEGLKSLDLNQVLTEGLKSLNLGQVLSEGLKDVDLNQVLSEGLKDIDLSQVLGDGSQGLDLSQLLSDSLQGVDLAKLLGGSMDNMDLSTLLGSSLGELGSDTDLASLLGTTDLSALGLSGSVDLSTLNADALGASLAGSSTPSGITTYGDAAAFSIADADTMNVVIAINELDILSVEIGQSAEVTMDAIEGETFSGVVTKIAKTGTNSGGATKYQVTVEIPRDDRMRPDMSSTVAILVNEARDVDVLPTAAIFTEQGKNYVYTVKENDGTLSGKTEIQTGSADGEYVEIVSGLESGQTVYYRNKTVNYFDIMMAEMEEQ